MDLLAVFVLFLAVYITWFHFLSPNSRHRKAAKLPPGPYPLPIVGNIFQLGKNPHQSLSKLSKTYGPLMSLHLGSIYTIIVSSSQMAKEILHSHEHAFSSRAVPGAAEAQDHDKFSIMFLPVGSQWRKLRKLSQEQMFTTSRLAASQALRQEKLDKLRDYVQRSCDGGRAVDILQAVLVTSLNLTSATLFSEQIADFDSNSTREFQKNFEGLTRIVGVPNFADFFPVLKPIDPQGIRRKSEFYFGKWLGFMEDLINERLRTRRKGSPKKTDMLETLIDFMEGSEYDLSFDDVKHLLMDLFIGGSDTTTGAIGWAMTELLVNPDKLSKAKHELRTVIGEGKQMQESDISKLPYFQAVIKEALRLHPPGPFLLPRLAEYDIRVGGYTIPKGTQILVNVWAIARDSNIWSNPNSFEPERFLDNKVDFKGQNLELIPFGSGKRICLGLPLANRTVHMMVATLIHNFDWKLEVGIAEKDQVHQEEMIGVALRRRVPLQAIPIKP